MNKEPLTTLERIVFFLVCLSAATISFAGLVKIFEFILK